MPWYTDLQAGQTYALSPIDSNLQVPEMIFPDYVTIVLDSNWPIMGGQLIPISWTVDYLKFGVKLFFHRQMDNYLRLRKYQNQIKQHPECQGKMD